MFFTLPRLTPGYIRLLQTYHNVAVVRPLQKPAPGLAMLLGTVGIGVCGYSSRQLTMNHRPSPRVLKWGYQEISPPSFAAQKVAVE